MSVSFAVPGLVVAAAACVSSSCSDHTAALSPDRPVRLALSVEGHGTGALLSPGASAQLQPAVFDAAGFELQLSGSLTLTSRNSSVVRVDSANRLYAVSKGNTVVFGSLVMDGETLTDSVVVSVVDMPPSGPGGGTP